MRGKVGVAGVFMLLSSIAHAQSSVTLYGIIDEGLNYTTNTGGQHAYELESGYAAGSRWGVSSPASNGYLTPGTFPAGVTVSSLNFDNFEVNAKYDFTPAFFAQAMYTCTLGKYEGSNASARPKWQQAGLINNPVARQACAEPLHSVR